jgi:hypothetical protein
MATRLQAAEDAATAEVEEETGTALLEPDEDPGDATEPDLEPPSRTLRAPAGRLNGLKKAAMARTEEVRSKAQSTVAKHQGATEASQKALARAQTALVRAQGAVVAGQDAATRGRDWVGDRLASTMHPANPEWANLSVKDRSKWWYWRIGPAAAMVAAMPAIGGRLGVKTQLGEVLGAASQAILVSAVAYESGIVDPVRHVPVAAEILLRCKVSEADVVALVERSRVRVEALRAEPAAELAGRPSMRLIWQCAQEIRSVEPMLRSRPKGSLFGRMFKVLPGLGAAGAFVSELGGLRKVVKKALRAYRV